MVEVVINYNKDNQNFQVYEPTTDTLLVSSNLTEALVNLSIFLNSAGLLQGDILDYPEISYHLDSYTVKSMVESNVNLIKRLQTAPSGFTISSQRFGGTSGLISSKKSNNSTGFSESYKNSDRKFNKKSSSNFSEKSGFRTANKKFGGK